MTVLTDAADPPETAGPADTAGPPRETRRSAALPAEDPEVRFRHLYAAHVDAILGYALRRVEAAEDASDVVAETFLVAWRRLHQVPLEPQTRLWLYGVARRTLANHRRSTSRRGALGERLRDELARVVPDHAQSVADHLSATDALSRLARRDREVLELSAWEGLEPREIAEVLGTSAVAVRTRLSRSRARLRELLPSTDLTPQDPR